MTVDDQGPTMVLWLCTLLLMLQFHCSLPHVTAMRKSQAPGMEPHSQTALTQLKTVGHQSSSGGVAALA